MPRINSSAVEQVEYEPKTRTLDVWYTGGKGYSYLGVPARDYEALLEAPSAGAFVNQWIKPRYRFRRKPGPPRRR